MKRAVVFGCFCLLGVSLLAAIAPDLCAQAKPRDSAPGTVDPCGGDPRCFVLTDIDGDGNYADDFQLRLNQLAYSAYATVTVTNEEVATDSDRFFGTNADGDASTPDSADPLDETPVARYRSASCTNGKQKATFVDDGTITGSVTTSELTVTGQDILCPDSTCTSGTEGTEYLDSPIKAETVVCSRSGASNVVFSDIGACTGPATLCTIDENTGHINLWWSAGSGATTCTYNRGARNTFDADSGIISARWASSVTGITECDYTYVTSANGGLFSEAITVAPPTTDRTVEWNGTVHYCKTPNSLTPEGYQLPACSGANAGSDDIPTLRWTKEWDGYEIICNPTLTGGGNVATCFRMGSEDGSRLAPSTRPGLEMIGAPLFTTAKTGVTPGTDFMYMVWLAGVDDSIVRLRLENTGDTDIAGLVLAADASMVEVGSRNGAAQNLSTVVMGSQTNTGTTIAGLSGQDGGYHLRSLFLGEMTPSFKDPALGIETNNGNTNGCGVSATAYAGCDSMVIKDLGVGGSINIQGMPRDLVLSGIRANLTTSSEVNILAHLTVAGTPSTWNGPVSVNCVRCSRLNIHPDYSWNSAITPLEPDAFKASGVIDFIQNGAMITSASGPVGNDYYRNKTLVLLDNWMSMGAAPPYNLTAVTKSYAYPGMIDVVGSPDLEWFVDGQGAVSSNTCMKKKNVALAGTATLASSCGGYDAFYDYGDRRYVGSLRVRLLEDVPSTATRCDIAVEVAGACTACNTGFNEPSGGYVAKYGGLDLFGQDLRDAGDESVWAINDLVDAGQDITIEVRDPTGQTDCEAGSGCDCDGLNAVEVSVDLLPGTLLDE